MKLWQNQARIERHLLKTLVEKELVSDGGSLGASHAMA